MAVNKTLPSSGSDDFDKLRDHLAANSTVRKEVENAFAFLLARINPSDRAARFVVGGTVEWIVAAAAWSAKALTVPGGHNVNGFDLTDVLHQAKGLWSIKFGSQKNPGDWRLTNGLGGAGKGFVEPTIFVHKKLGGLLYIDPANQPSVVSQVVNDGDATKLAFKVTRDFSVTHPECVAIVDVPINEGQAANDPHMFIRELLSPTTFPNLAKVFSDAAPVQKSVVEELKGLVKMRDSGDLSDEQFELFKDKVIGLPKG